MFSSWSEDIAVLVKFVMYIHLLYCCYVSIIYQNIIVKKTVAQEITPQNRL